MKRNIITSILLMLLSIFCITGCGKVTLKESKMMETLPNDLKLAFVDDIPYTLDVEKFEITKRKTNEDYDVVYCTLIAKNETYQVTRNMVLYYVYYDKGGWILDDYQIESARTEAISGFPQKLADLEMSNYYFDAYTYKGEEFFSESQSTVTTYDVSFTGSNLSYEGEVTLTSKFVNDGNSGFWAKNLRYNDNGFDVLIDGNWAIAHDDFAQSGNWKGAYAAEVEFVDINMDKYEVVVNATGYYQGIHSKKEMVEKIEMKPVALFVATQGYEPPNVNISFSSEGFEYDLTVEAEVIQIKLRTSGGQRKGQLYKGDYIRSRKNDFGWIQYVRV